MSCKHEKPNREAGNSLQGKTWVWGKESTICDSCQGKGHRKAVEREEKTVKWKRLNLIGKQKSVKNRALAASSVGKREGAAEGKNWGNHPWVRQLEGKNNPKARKRKGNTRRRDAGNYGNIENHQEGPLNHKKSPLVREKSMEKWNVSDCRQLKVV